MAVCSNCNYLRRVISKQDEEMEVLTATIQDLRAKLKATTKPNPVYLNRIPEDKLDRLIRLCHPDRHGNSVIATEITQWLLQQRGKQ